MICSPDDPEDPLSEAPAEWGRGGGKQEGGTVPAHPERAGWGEGDNQPPTEAAAWPTPADQVWTVLHACRWTVDSS